MKNNRRMIVSATMVTIICLVMLGYIFTKQQDNNMFSIKAYAMEQQVDGLIELREIDLISQSHVIGGYSKGNDLYLNIGLKYDGENIKSVEFSTDEGFFATQSINKGGGKAADENVPKVYVGENHTLAVYGTDSEKVGNKFKIDSGIMPDDLLLFLGIENFNMKTIESGEITIRAVVTFNNNKKQEENITVDFASTEGIILLESSPAESPGSVLTR